MVGAGGLHPPTPSYAFPPKPSYQAQPQLTPGTLEALRGFRTVILSQGRYWEIRFKGQNFQGRWGFHVAGTPPFFALPMRLLSTGWAGPQWFSEVSHEQARLPQGWGLWSEKQTSGCKEAKRAEVRMVVGRRQEWAWATRSPSQLPRHSRGGCPQVPLNCSHRWASNCPGTDVAEVGRPLGLGAQAALAGSVPNAAPVNPPSLCWHLPQTLTAVHAYRLQSQLPICSTELRKNRWERQGKRK